MDSSLKYEESNFLGKINEGWIKSITSISTPHNGTTLSDILTSGIPFLQDFIALAAVVGNSFYDFDLEHWGFRRENKEAWGSYFSRMRKHPAWGTKNIVAWDVSVEGAREMNSICTANSNIYYFSYVTSNTLLDSTGYHELKNKPMCWKNNDPNSPCWYHSYEFAKDVFSLYLISAIWLKDELDEEEFQIVDRYINRMYHKFLKPLINKKQDQGFYAMANGGTGILIYSNWSNDKRLAVREINNRLKYIDKVFLEDGYINNNSFRGYRGQWYHSYGLNSVLGYIYIAKLWGAKIPNKIQQKLINALISFC
jgi:triacylglycerol esterase/lipase EstA (alpha/beta hydrolase family)